MAACYRGSAPFDSPATRALVAKWVGFYKAHRGTLVQPVVHLRRADLQSWDGFMHVNPFAYTAGDEEEEHDGGGDEVALAMLFNPTAAPLSAAVALPLYYAGLAAGDAALVSVDGGAFAARAVGRGDAIVLQLEMAAVSVHTVVIRRQKQE